LTGPVSPAEAFVDGYNAGREVAQAACDDQLEAARQQAFVMGYGMAIMNLGGHLKNGAIASDSFRYAPRRFDGEFIAELMTSFFKRLWKEMAIPKEFVYWKPVATDSTTQSGK
jgi:hypothetical protein